MTRASRRYMTHPRAAMGPCHFTANRLGRLTGSPRIPATFSAVMRTRRKTSSQDAFAGSRRQKDSTLVETDRA